jgi:predicted AlkP superfamily pyrophosphatase or phosphodiesterase
MLRNAFGLLTGLLLCLGEARPSQINTGATLPTDDIVILLSIDGFRWDYIELHETPVIGQLAREGVRAGRMTPEFPTKTFPNHYTLVTGLRPESHGIVANWFFDPRLQKTFSMSKTEAYWWEAGEPIWITAEKQGVRSGCFFWPGSETELQGRRPTLYRPFEKNLTCAQRVDGLLAWLDLPPEQRPRFFTLYFDLVDTQGHNFGPTAPETREAAREADDAIARLLAGLEQRGLRERTNLVLVSDHGMSETSPDRVVFIEDLVDTALVQVESLGPNGGVRPKSDTISAAELAAVIRAKAPPQVQVYLREEVPVELHYRKSDRIPPVVLIAEDHWNIESKVGWPLRRATYSKGSHGWDLRLPNMGAFFAAHGPAFKRGHTFSEARSLDVYELLCALLGVRPAAHEGDSRLAREVLR